MARPEGSGSAAPDLSREQVELRITTVFGARQRRSRSAGRSAAVGIVVAEQEGVLGFLLTLRAAGLARHANQYALPGGVVDRGERVEQAALRELAEEVGLHLGEADVLGRLPPYQTRSGFLIHPIVIWAPGIESLQAAADEVAEIFHIPLAALGAPEVPILVEVEGSDKPLIRLPLGEGRLIHAPTGAILYQFGQAVLAGRFVDAQAFEEPRFAWQ